MSARPRRVDVYIGIVPRHNVLSVGQTLQIYHALDYQVFLIYHIIQYLRHKRFKVGSLSVLRILTNK